MSDELQVEIASLLCPAFHSVHRAIKQEIKNEIWLKGGRGSTKSSFTAIQILLGVMRDKNANAICLRKVGDTIRTSLFTTFLWAISVLRVESYFSSTASPSVITYIPTGQKIFLKGLDDPTKLKSVKAQAGYFKYLWFEEASEFHGMNEIRSVEQSVLRGGKKFVEFITYNPPNDPAAWVNEESLIEYPNRLVHASTYLDVPNVWLGDKFIELAERLKEQDPLKYAHEYLGEAVGRSEQIIFANRVVVQDFDTPADARFYHGVDWGFANDPTVEIRCFILKDCLYVDMESVGYGVEIDETSQLFDKIPTARKWPIKADNARPETISYMKRQGFNIVAAEKWPGCIEDRITYLKGFKKIIVHTRCTHTAKEFRMYSYKVDKVTQDILPIVVDAWNHCIDAIGYALDGLIKKAPQSIFEM